MQYRGCRGGGGEGENRTKSPWRFARLSSGLVSWDGVGDARCVVPFAEMMGEPHGIRSVV